jgi:glyoxylase-like metal-dependent hydrolase (beta-lactamase superfamily II)
MTVPERVADGVYAVDTGHVRPGLAAAHVWLRAGEAAVVDPGPAPAAGRVLGALAQLGVARDAVRYLFVTHVHLDHAGGAGTLADALPQAQVVAHPRALRHLADPGRLVAGTIAVYGPERTRAMYGEVAPVAPERLIAAGEGFTLAFGGSTLRFLDTPGHARHHYVLHDPDGGAVFAGDTFGIRYRELDTPAGPFVFPTTTPVQFDPAALHASVDRILALAPARVFLMHYSVLEAPARVGAMLHEAIDAHVPLAREEAAAGKDRLERRLAARILDAWLADLRRRGCMLDAARQAELVRMDAELNAQGLGVWLEGAGRA